MSKVDRGAGWDVAGRVAVRPRCQGDSSGRRPRPRRHGHGHRGDVPHGETLCVRGASHDAHERQRPAIVANDGQQRAAQLKPPRPRRFLLGGRGGAAPLPPMASQCTPFPAGGEDASAARRPLVHSSAETPAAAGRTKPVGAGNCPLLYEGRPPYPALSRRRPQYRSGNDQAAGGEPSRAPRTWWRRRELNPGREPKFGRKIGTT